MSIHGLILEVRVTGCRKLRDTEFFTRQDPYVVLEYATTKLRTRTCTGRYPPLSVRCLFLFFFFNFSLSMSRRDLLVVAGNRA